MFTVHRKNKKYMFCLILVASLTLLSVGCADFFQAESPQYISYAIENIEEAEDFFKKEQITLDIREEDETTYLEITTALDEVYLYRDSSYFDRLCTVEKKVSYEKNGEIEERQFIMRVQDDELVKVCVNAEIGGLCLDYYLPNFDKIVSRWGDTMYAQTIIESYISPKEMIEVHETGQEIEQKIIEFYKYSEDSESDNFTKEYSLTEEYSIMRLTGQSCNARVW